MAKQEFNEVCYKSADELVFGKAKKPVKLDNGMVIGGGTVYPELNYTLPPMTISQETMPKVIAHYKEMTTGVCEKAVELDAPGMLIEIELLPPCTFEPKWGIEVNNVVKEIMNDFQAKRGLKSALRITPVDIREGKDLKHMYKGMHWDNVMETFRGSGKGGADFFAIESIGGKHLHDDATMNCDLPKALFSLGVVGCRDMVKLWDEIVKIAGETNSIPAGDTACGFANTSMVLAHKNFIPSVFAAVDRVMCAVRTMVAVECGAVGPDKDCGYEGVYLKAITGTPISMEGKSSACAHSSHLGNIAAALCDCWSNESVENQRMLGGMAPTVSIEQLIYDARLMNVATAKGQALMLRDMFVESDAKFDPQAYIMHPEVVLAISNKIVKGKTHFERTKLAAAATIEALKEGVKSGKLLLKDREIKYLTLMEQQLASVPDDEAKFTEMMIKSVPVEQFDPAKYDF